MSSTPVHLAVGALAAALPDIALLAVVGRRDWLPRDHPAIRLHAWLHQSPWGLVIAAASGWATHLLLDRYTRHATPDGPAYRGWRW